MLLEVCEKINEKLTGSTAIPELTGPVREVLIDESHSTAAGNISFTSAICPTCYGQPSLCVKDNGVSSWSFYSIIRQE